MKFIKHVWPLAIALLLIYVFHNAWGMLPPLGKLLSPFHGYLQNAEARPGDSDTEIVLPGITGEVVVRYDDNAVPHIFAQNDEDLYFAQGYVIARDRLWQMEFYTLVAAGRLTEVVGEAVLEYDRFTGGWAWHVPRRQLPSGWKLTRWPERPWKPMRRV